MGRDEALLRAFADELRARRGRWTLSQETLAGRAGLNRTYVAKLELAKNQPTLRVLYRLAISLNCTLPELMDGVMERYARLPHQSAEASAQALPAEIPDTKEQSVSFLNRLD